MTGPGARAPFPLSDRPRLWGVAVSHYQVERDDPCDWTDWEAAGRTNGGACGRAADSWNLYEDEWRSVAGEWRGDYTNSLGGEGKSALSLHEDSHGNLSGTWDGTPVRGDRINGNAIELRARTEKRSYQITGTREGRVMVLRRLVTRLDSSGVYDGTARLRREH